MNRIINYLLESEDWLVVTRQLAPLHWDGYTRVGVGYCDEGESAKTMSITYSDKNNTFINDEFTGSIIRCSLGF